MEKTLIITDVTRMKSPRVCIAGITDNGETLRPTLPHPGIQENWLYSENKAVIRPFARVIFNFIKQESQKPHTEDWQIDTVYKWHPDLLNITERKTLLLGIAEKYLNDLFHAPLQQIGQGYFIPKGEGQRSLATLAPKQVNFIGLCEEYGEMRYRIKFTDWSGTNYMLTVTDLSFRYFVEYLRIVRKLSCHEINCRLEQLVSNAEIFLRLGLARGFNPDKQGSQDRCYLQVTGIYTFPDYLQLKCFADYSQQ